MNSLVWKMVKIHRLCILRTSQRNESITSIESVSLWLFLFNSRSIEFNWCFSIISINVCHNLFIVGVFISRVIEICCAGKNQFSLFFRVVVIFSLNLEQSGKKRPSKVSFKTVLFQSKWIKFVFGLTGKNLQLKFVTPSMLWTATHHKRNAKPANKMWLWMKRIAHVNQLHDG